MSDNNAEHTGRWLRGRLSDAERKAFESSPEGRDFRDIIAAADMLKAPAYNAGEALQQLKQRLATSAPAPAQGRVVPFRKWAPLAAAASLLLFVSVYYIFFAQTTYSTAFGERSTVVLPDGSLAELHTHTTLRIRKWNFENHRKVTLSGEAYFEVEPGTPFEVVTTVGKVEVLGTSFNVKENLGALNVECYTGKVAVSDAGRSHLLTPGLGLRIGPSGETSQWQHNAGAPAWKLGKSVFNNVALSEVLAELEYLYGIGSTVPPGIDTLRYQGAFPHNDVDAAVKLALDPLNLDYVWNKEQSSLVINGLKP